MEGRLLLKDCAVVRPGGGVSRGLAVLLEGDQIARVAPDAKLPVLPGDWEVACQGRLVAPGRVETQARLVEGVLTASRTGAAVVRGEDVEALTALALARGLKAGATSFIELLRCPSDVAGGLAAQGRAARRLGARLVHGHASSSEDEWAANQSYAEGQVRPAGPVRAVLGVDDPGAPPEVLASARRVAADLKRPVLTASPRSAEEGLALLGELFGARFGVIEEGAAADLVVYDHVVANPAEDLAWSLRQSTVAWTVVAGRVAVREGRLLGESFVDLARDAADVLRRLGGGRGQ